MIKCQILEPIISAKLYLIRKFIQKYLFNKIIEYPKSYNISLMASNQSSKVSIQAESQITEKKNKTKKQLIIEMVKQWQHSFDVEKKDYHYCYEIFILKYSRISGINIHFDNSVSNILAEISKQIDFLQFQDKKVNELKMALQFINEILKQKMFISERQYNKFKSSWLSNSLEDSIYLLEHSLRNQGYLRKKNQSQNIKKIDFKNLSEEDKKNLKNLWELCMVVSLDTFWLFILRQKIEHKQLLVIFKVYDGLMKQNQSLIQIRNQVFLYLIEWYERKRQQKLQPIRKIETSIVEYDHFLDLRAEEISVYLNKDRLESYKKQYNQLTDYLSKRCSQKITFQPYGSFKSKFLIVKYSDIDVGLYYKNEKLKKRENVIQVLEKIHETIQADRSCISNCLYTKKFTAQRIKVPFVKVIYNNSRGRNLQVVSTMDIIINNYEGIENSNLLALYAEDEYLLKFCNLIKYWAVSRNLINLDKKMEGLSSYGVVLMCLYYLMVTKQIPFLRKINGQYEIGRDHFNISMNFLDNFIGFLQFYSNEYTDQQKTVIYYGKFHKQKRIVCLMEEHEGKKVYDKGIIINMYDFIDGSNPGRMRSHLQGKFNMIFQETLNCLYERSISFLEIVYNYNQSDHKTYQNKVPRRGNRVDD